MLRIALHWHQPWSDESMVQRCSMSWPAVPKEKNNKRIPDQYTCSKSFDYICFGWFEDAVHHLKLLIYWGSKSAMCGHQTRLDGSSYPIFCVNIKNTIGQHSSWVAEGQRAAIAALEKMCLNTATQARWFPKSDFKTPFFHVLGANNHRQCGYILEFSGLNTISTYQSLSS